MSSSFGDVDMDYQCLHYQGIKLATNHNRTLSDIDPCKDCLSVPGCLWCHTPTMTQCLSIEAVNRGECYTTENRVPRPHDPTTDDVLIHCDDDGMMIQHDPGITCSSKDQCPITLSKGAAITVLIVSLLLALFVVGMMAYSCYLQQEKKKKKERQGQLPIISYEPITITMVSSLHMNGTNGADNVVVLVHINGNAETNTYMPISQLRSSESDMVQDGIISPLHFY